MIHFKQNIRPEVKSIYTHRTIVILAGSFFGTFGIIFLYEILNKSLINLALFSAASSLGYIFILPFTKKIIEKIGGFKEMIIVGTIMNTLLLLSYLITSYFNLSWGWVLILLTMIFLRVFYWVPMHTELSEISTKENRGHMLANMRIIANAVGILSPAISGFIISEYGFYSTFLIGFLISLLAVIPLLHLQEKTKKEVSWNSKKIIKEFINPLNRKFILALYARGVEVSVGLVVWPIFIYELLKGDFLTIGILSTGITLIVILINILQGKISDKNKLRNKMMKYGTFFYSFGWFLRIFATTATYIFIIDIYQRMSHGFSFISFDAFVYDYISDQGNLVDEYTILREAALHFGKITGFILIIIGSLLLPLNYLFVIAVLATIALNILPVEKDAHNELINP